MKVRSPKAEGRKKSEVRSPKTRQRGFNQRLRISAFGFRPSFGLRTSAFGLRLFLSSLWLLSEYSLLAATTNSPAPDGIPPLRPPRAELPPTFWEQYGFWVIVTGAVVLTLAAVAAWLLARPKPPVIVPPDTQARRALEVLRPQPEDGVLLSRVSQILHQYVTAAFHLPPEELTTAEFCHDIAQHKDIGPELAAALSDFLHQCDQRKFSPPAPAPPLSAIAQALKLIDQAQARIVALPKPDAPTSPNPNPPHGSAGT